MKLRNDYLKVEHDLMICNLVIVYYVVDSNVKYTVVYLILCLFISLLNYGCDM